MDTYIYIYIYMRSSLYVIIMYPNITIVVIDMIYHSSSCWFTPSPPIKSFPIKSP